MADYVANAHYSFGRCTSVAIETRSFLLRGLIAGTLLLILAGANVVAAVEALPNIVILVSDDLDYGSLGYTGYQEVTTPHLDSVIRGGTFFTNGYVSGPVCAPTRAGLMTGRYQARMNYETLTGPIERQIADDYGVDTQEILLPQLLNEAGYTTAVIGKWHLGYNDKYHPNNRGVDYFFGFLAGGHDYFIWDTPPTKAQGGPILRNQEQVHGDGYLTDALAQEAAAFIRDHHNEPFLLYFSPYNVHLPHVVPEKYLPPSGDVMGGMVKAMDESAGAILAALEEFHLADEAFIIYVNDNGGIRNNGPFRGKKGELFEGGIHVPFAMRWPGRIPAGGVYEQPVIQLDILPTVLAAARIKLPADRAYDGVNLLPYLAGENAGAPHDALFWRYPNHSRAVRLDNLKLVLPDAGRGEPQLFDLGTDPYEQHDLAHERPQDVAQLIDAIENWEANVKAERF